MISTDWTPKRYSCFSSRFACTVSSQKKEDFTWLCRNYSLRELGCMVVASFYFYSGGILMNSELNANWDEFMDVLKMICDDMDRDIQGS